MRFPKATTIRLQVKKGDEGLFYGTSLDLNGLLIAETSVDKVCEKAPEVIAGMYHAAGVDSVEILTIGTTEFVAIPRPT